MSPALAVVGCALDISALGRFAGWDASGGGAEDYGMHVWVGGWREWEEGILSHPKRLQWLAELVAEDGEVEAEGLGFGLRKVLKRGERGRKTYLKLGNEPSDPGFDL